CVVEGAFGGDIDPADVLGRESFPVHQSMGGVRPHRHDVLFDVGERTRVESESLREFLGVVAHRGRERFGEVESQLSGVNLDAVDTDASHGSPATTIDMILSIQLSSIVEMSDTVSQPAS